MQKNQTELASWWYWWGTIWKLYTYRSHGFSWDLGLIPQQLGGSYPRYSRLMKQTMDNCSPPSPAIPTKLLGKGNMLKSLVRPLVCPCFVRTISSEAFKLLLTQLGMAMHDHKPECPTTKDWFANPHGHGHSEGSYQKFNRTVSILSVELLHQSKCKQNGQILTVKPWLRILPSTHMEGEERGRVVGGEGGFYFAWRQTLCFLGSRQPIQLVAIKIFFFFFLHIITYFSIRPKCL